MKKVIHIRPHARKQLTERGIVEILIRSVLLAPDQVIDSYSNRKIAQSIIRHNKEKFLIRIVYEELNNHINVVTVYLTKKIEKYWR